MRPSSQNLVAVATTVKTVARRGHATPHGSGVIPSAASQRSLCTVCASDAPSHGRASTSNSQVRLMKRPTSRVILPAVFTAGQRRRASVVSDAAVENGTYMQQFSWPGLTLFYSEHRRYWADPGVRPTGRRWTDSQRQPPAR